MASLKVIRKRIASVRSTQQITKAMKMVAAAKLRRAQEAVVRSRAYAAKLAEVVAGLAAEPSLREHRLVQSRDPESRVLLVVVTADRGLCGGFNANLHSPQRGLPPHRAAGPPSLGIVGRKGYDFYKRRAVTIAAQLHRRRRHRHDRARARDRRALDAVVRRRRGRRRLRPLQQFRSALSQVPTVERLLPIEPPSTETPAREYLFEPGREEVIEDLLPRYVEVKVLQAMLESIASEHGARMTAMESATKNASDMIERLTLEMNRARQAAITKELMEIVGGAEALKG